MIKTIQYALILLIVSAGCVQNNTIKDGKKEVLEPTQNVPTTSNENNTDDVYIPEYDYSLEQEIRTAVSSIVDPQLIHKIYQYETHNVVHVLDRKNQENTGLIYVSKDLKDINRKTVSESNPYKFDLPTDTKYLGLPMYLVKDLTRKEIENKVDNVNWDNKGEPNHIYTKSISSNFGATNIARGYNLTIVGTEGSMAAQSQLHIENNKGVFVDSIKYDDSEIWHPAITDNGRYIAYYHGRSFPVEGGGKLIQNFTIYDIETRKVILEIENFDQDGSRIGFMGNFFNFNITEENGKNYYYVIDPSKSNIYKILTDEIISVGAGAFKHDGVYEDPNDPPDLKLLSWNEDFETIDFINYKHHDHE